MAEAIFAAAFLARLAELATQAPGGQSPWGPSNGNTIVIRVQIYDVKLARYVPYPGVPVSLSWLMPTGSDPPTIPYESKLTDDLTGEARFANLPDGGWWVVVSPPEGLQATSIGLIGPNAGTSRTFSVLP